MKPETIVDLMESALRVRNSVEPAAGALFTNGRSVFSRTVTHSFTGRVVGESHGLVVLESAAWIADTGRFSDALESLDFAEVEPLPSPYHVNIACITDWCEVTGTLPTEQK